MSLSERADLVARLSLDDKFSKPLSGAQKKLSGFGSALGRVGKTAGIAIGAATTVASAVVVKNVQSGLDSLAQLEDATTSVDGAIKQLGLTGKITSTQIAGWANEIETATQAAFDDKDITKAATALLRYGRVAPQNLRETLTVMTDLAAKTGSVDSAADKLAKSLADPTKATRLLREAGVTLTKDQQKQIATWVKAGKLGKAQSLILAEVSKQTKGAAAAMNGPYRDSQLVFQDVVEDAQRALATGFLPVLEEIRKELSEELAKPETLNRIKEFGTGLAGGLRSVVGFVKSIPWDQVGSVLKGAATLGQNLAGAFMGLPTEAKGLILGLAALNKLSGGAVINVGVDILKGAGGTLFSQFLGKGSPANPMYVVPVGGGLGGATSPSGGGTGSVLANAIGTAGVAATVAGGTLAIQDIQSGTEEGVKRGLLTAAGGFPAMIGRAVGEVIGDPLGDLLHTQRNTATDTSVADRAQQQKLDALKERLEANRIAAVTSKTAIVAGAHSDRNAIVTAIRAIQRPIVNIGVTSTLVRVTYATGGTLSRYSGKLIPES